MAGEIKSVELLGTAKQAELDAGCGRADGGQLNPIHSNFRAARDPGPRGHAGVFPSASPRGLDGGNIDLLHRHHRLEGALCLSASSRKRIG